LDYNKTIPLFVRDFIVDHGKPISYGSSSWRPETPTARFGVFFLNGGTPNSSRVGRISHYTSYKYYKYHPAIGVTPFMAPTRSWYLKILRKNHQVLTFGVEISSVASTSMALALAQDRKVENLKIYEVIVNILLNICPV